MNLVDPRALAAQTLAEVVRGASLREALSRAQPQLPDARDRALLTALASAGARWWLRFDPALDRLLDQPLRAREPALHALIVLGLVQLDILRVPPHAAVAATVGAARALRRAPFANLVNAVLRRWQRERETLNVQLDRDAATRLAHPVWLADALRRDWPYHADAIFAANNAPAPPMLRVNARRATREGVIESLRNAGVTARTHPDLRDALMLDANVDVARLPGFAQGLFSVQDGAAQYAAGLLDLRAGQRVLDACAAPGGKACHALERTDLELLALEREPSRVPRIRENLARSGLRCELRVGDAGDPALWWDRKPFDRILLDAPCSATGVIRRHPDIKLHRRETDIVPLARGQRRLLDALWPLLAANGRLVYATCSVLRDENERVIDAFLHEHGDAEPIAFGIGRAAGAGQQILPGEGGLDGMYYAVIRKRG